jgi:hypothetical protein
MESFVSRRSILAGLGAVSLAAAVRTRLAWAAGSSGPPVARIEPVTETLWGETVVDPYRWMEDDKDREVRRSTRARRSTRFPAARNSSSASQRSPGIRA